MSCFCGSICRTIHTISTHKIYICIYFYTTTTQRSFYIYVPLHTCHITLQQLSLPETFFSFYAYAATVFLSFLETNNISGYLVTRCHGGIISSPFIQPTLDYHSTSHTSTSTSLHSHTTFMRANFLRKQSPNK